MTRSPFQLSRNNCTYLTMHKRQMTKEWGGKEESSLELVVAPVMAPRRPCVTRCHRQNAAHTHTALKSEKDFTNMRLKTKVWNRQCWKTMTNWLRASHHCWKGRMKDTQFWQYLILDCLCVFLIGYHPVHCCSRVIIRVRRWEGSRASSSHDSSSNSGSFQRGSHFLFRSTRHSTLTMVLSSETWVNPLTIHFI